MEQKTFKCMQCVLKCIFTGNALSVSVDEEGRDNGIKVAAEDKTIQCRITSKQWNYNC